jgi:hypothetical protein
MGGLLNAISGFGFDVANPYNEPYRVLATLLGAAPGLALALTAQGIALYDSARRDGKSWLIGLLIWPVALIVEACLMFAGALAFPDYWFLPLVALPLAPLVYTMTTPKLANSSPTPGSDLKGTTARPGLIVFWSVLTILMLVSLVGLVVPQVVSSASAASGQRSLQVMPSGSTADCANSSYPSITLSNSSSQTVQWSARTWIPT